MNPWLKWTLIGCGSLVALWILAMIAGFVLLVVLVRNISFESNGKIGTTMQIPQYLNVTLTGVTVVQGSSENRPRHPGDAFIVTHWRIVNPSGTWTRFQTQNMTGWGNNPEYHSQLSQHLIPRTGAPIRAHGTYTGDMVFEVPARRDISITFPWTENYNWVIRS
jgi:hypothetical protein